MGRLGFLALAALLSFSGCASFVMLSASPDPWIGHYMVGVSPTEEKGLSASEMAPYRKILVVGFVGKQGDEVARLMRERLTKKGYLALGPLFPDSAGLLSPRPVAYQEAGPGVPALLSSLKMDAILVGMSHRYSTDPLEVKLFMELLDANDGKVIWSNSGQYKSGRFIGRYDYFKAMRFLVEKALKSLPRLSNEGSFDGGASRDGSSKSLQSAQSP